VRVVTRRRALAGRAGQSFKVSTGDTAVGQIHPSDLAQALATLLGIPEAAGKTVELRSEGSGGMFGRGTKSELTKQMAMVEMDPQAAAAAAKAAAAATATTAAAAAVAGGGGRR
jgi:hypothetical protein